MGHDVAMLNWGGEVEDTKWLSLVIKELLRSLKPPAWVWGVQSPSLLMLFFQIPPLLFISLLLNLLQNGPLSFT